MKKMISVFVIVSVLLIVAIPAAGFAGASQAGGQLVIYTSVPTTQLNMMVDMFNERYPDVMVDVYSANNKDLVARVQAEEGAPQGDILMGASLSAFQTVANQLAAYETPNTQAIHDAYLVEGMECTPVQLNVSAILVNPAAAAKLGATVDGWASLKDANLSGHILYADPAASSPDAQQAAVVNYMASSLDIPSKSAPSFVLNAVDAGQFAVGIISEDKAIARKMADPQLDINNPQVEKEVWLFLGNIISQKHFEETLAKEKPAAYVIHAAYLLHATMADVASVGAKLKIFCSL